MRPNFRSVSGAILMLAIIPIFAGLLACMPVPIGDPEKARIDPDINGVWVLEMDDELNGLYHFQPFDRRAWILTGVPLEEGPDYEGENFDLEEDFDLETADDVFQLLDTVGVGDDGVTATSTIIYKAWLTKLGKHTFMNWEMTTAFNEDGDFPEAFWFVFRVDKVDENRIDLHVVNSEHDAFDDLKEPAEGLRAHEYPDDIRRDWERALKKAARNEEDEDLYIEEPWSLRRVPDELLGEVSDLFGEVIEFE